MAHSHSKTMASKQAGNANPFKLTRAKKAGVKDVHIIREGVRCDTEKRGHTTPHGRTPLEIVVDASEGFIPLWAKGTTLRWRFRDNSFAVFENQAAAKAAVEQLLGQAILKWGDSAPVKFAKRDDSWDFEVVMRSTDDCDDNGCVLASAFFPDAGRHKLTLYPRMFEQPSEEQVETLIHEIGHIFGLRHFFALVSETDWPAEIFGEHKKFSIMNYGNDSKLTSQDTFDLKRLYQMVWSGLLTEVNGTPIRIVKPFHASGAATESALAIAATRTVVAPLPGA
ncbi:matrixin family metalloprotease [Mesorhizobium sp.]|uniref:matrixin family metalloprotease n=1 Tax=Mesorhizobium sp. TaxID=1871066 RepID=UPI0025C0E47E|nr:matrixin family metalloprotease [Mesorhizobium sp.]